MTRATGMRTNRMGVRLLIRMAWQGIRSNGNVYYPFLAAGIFSVFVYFVFSSILWNDIIKILPKSAYAWVMLEIGKALLAVILLLFLVYANGFLVKRRRKEFGLYHILGLEKKHIGGMMFFEGFLLYGASLGGGIVFGTVFSKLLFLLLLKVCRLSLDVRFFFEPEAFWDTVIYFGMVYLLNFAGSLWQVSRARPVELMSGGRKGEKEPRFLWFYALAGIMSLGGGYYCSVTSKIDGMIFMNFFLAVFLVIIGTYLLFTSGSIALLKRMRVKKGIYYRPKNFITISGMFYRMKKSAAGLSNLCIFSTMVMITLICTVALCIGMDGCVRFDYPYDITLYYQKEKVGREDVMREIGILEEKYDVIALRVEIYDRLSLSVRKQDRCFVMQEEQKSGYEDYQMGILLQEDYNRIAQDPVSLSEDEALIYCSGEDFGYDTVSFYGMEFWAQETDNFFPEPKAKGNACKAEYMMVVKDGQVRDRCVRAWCEANGVEDREAVEAVSNSQVQHIQVLLQGAYEDQKAFVEEFKGWGQGCPGFLQFQNGLEQREDLQVMYGALLFIGILFALIFFMCLVLIMYYKQISEGYEDRGSFDIMRKVGMSGQEIQGTVRHQILMVFSMPFVGAVLHTIVGMFMVKGMMAVLSLFDARLLVLSAAGVMILFAAVYGVSYLVTARTYYRIVRQE